MLKFNGKNINDITNEEVNEFTKWVEKDPLGNMLITDLCNGNVNTFKDLINKEIEQFTKETNKDDNSKDKINSNQKLDLNPILQKPNFKEKAKEICDKNNYKNNINKRCIIKNHLFIKNNTEGQIVDVVKGTNQYVISINSNIIYADFNQVEIIEDKWKDIKLQGVDKELGEYFITIKEDKIIVNTFCEVMFNESNDTYTSIFSPENIAKLVDNLKNNKNNVIKFILANVQSNIYNTDYHNTKKEINHLNKKLDKLNNKIIKNDIDINALEKELHLNGR